MDAQRLSFIKMDALEGIDEDILSELEIANGILSGRYANYNGDDGPRCTVCGEVWCIHCGSVKYAKECQEKIGNKAD